MQPTVAKKILVVDDEPDILEFLSYALRKEGLQVITAMDGAQGIATAEREHPDLILLDIMMPKMDGIQTCRHLRSLPAFRLTPIAFLTAKDEDLTQIEALDTGGDDYITKPIKPRVLISRIQALLRRAEQGPSDSAEKITLNDLVVDRSRIEVTVEGRTIELPKKEFELLWLLAARPGRVFTRDEILDKIWGQDIIVGERTIDVHIRKLREKLGDRYIKTIKGIGYKIDF